MSFSMLRKALIAFVVLISASPSYAESEALSRQIQPLASSSIVTDIARVGESLVAVGERGHVLLKQKEWVQVLSPVFTHLTKVFFLNDALGWAVGHDATIIHTSDAGKTWSVQMSAPEIEKPFLDILFFDAKHGIAVGAYGMFYRTHDGGNTWTEEFHEELLLEDDVAYLEELKAEDEALYLSERAALLPHFNRVLPISDNRILMVGELGLVSVSHNQGKVFEKRDLMYEGSMFNAIETQTGVYVMGLRGHVFKASEALMDWSELSMPVESTINGALVSSDKLLLVGNAGAVIRVNGQDKSELLLRKQGENIVAIEQDSQGHVWLASTKGLTKLQKQ